jgi:hypothetical protein
MEDRRRAGSGRRAGTQNEPLRGGMARSVEHRTRSAVSPSGVGRSRARQRASTAVRHLQPAVLQGDVARTQLGWEAAPAHYARERAAPSAGVGERPGAGDPRVMTITRGSLAPSGSPVSASSRNPRTGASTSSLGGPISFLVNDFICPPGGARGERARQRVAPARHRPPRCSATATCGRPAARARATAATRGRARPSAGSVRPRRA